LFRGWVIFRRFVFVAVADGFLPDFTAMGLLLAGFFPAPASKA
jgi:hypothetical protein